jgi:CBS domain-containing protein
MLIKNLMTSEVKCCAPEAAVAAAARIMTSNNCGIVPVVDDDGKLVGVITDRDVCLAVATKPRSPEELRVNEIMTTQVYTCSPENDTKTVLNLMKNHAVRRLPVVTVDGRIAGLVSIDDLVLRTESRKGAAVSDAQVIAAFKANCAKAIAA